MQLLNFGTRMLIGLVLFRALGIRALRSVCPALIQSQWDRAKACSSSSFQALTKAVRVTLIAYLDSTLLYLRNVKSSLFNVGHKHRTTFQ